MLVLLEGIDRVGKTTLARKLEAKGFLYLKDAFAIKETLECFHIKTSFKDYSLGKCDTAYVFLKQLVEKGYNVVMDRMHITELVYGEIDRQEVSSQQLYEIDQLMSEIDSVLVYIAPTSLMEANARAGRNLSSHLDMFDTVYHLSSMRKRRYTFHELDDAVFELMLMAQESSYFKYDIYFASPFFNPEQVEREERLIDHLRGMGFSVFSPKESCFLNTDAELRERNEVFESNCNAIRESRAVFAVTDGKDVGTIWEAGFAYGINKPVLYYAETLGNNPFNLMLAQSGQAVFRKQKEVTNSSVWNAIHGICVTGAQYKGGIE